MTLYLNVGWMRDYKGIQGDKIRGGGAFVDKHGWGHEIFNFKKYHGHCYGYVASVGDINIERLGAKPGYDFIDGVLIVWVSRAPSGGTYIIGFYKNARVYAKLQDPPPNAGRVYKNDKIKYFVTTRFKDSFLLSVDERVIKVPRGKGGMGQSNIWYGDSSKVKDFNSLVRDYSKNKKAPEKLKKSQDTGSKYQTTDPARRKKVETAATRILRKHYEKLGYDVISVEKENLGWDFEAYSGDRKLRIEVKGLSQLEINAGLTPNEYKHMKKNSDDYRVAIVTDALGKPKLHLFSYSPDIRKWQDQNDNILKISKRYSAILTID